MLGAAAQQREFPRGDRCSSRRVELRSAATALVFVDRTIMVLQRRTEDAAAVAAGPAAAALVSHGLRDFLAATDGQLAASLSTQELAARLETLPLYLPAQSLLLTALQTADLAKFAGATAAPDILITQVREAVQRVEASRRAFAAPAPIRP